MNPKTPFFSALWTKLIGETNEFSVENRAFNAISIISFMVLLILLPFNIYMGLQAVWIIMVVVIAILLLLYYYSRVHKKYALSMSCYAICSYLILIANYFYNSGSLGPTLYLFFLTFQLLIAFTAKRQHIWWVILHGIITTILFSIEYFRPELIPNTYNSKADYFFDLSTSSIVIFICMYFITIYLRSNYNKEKQLVEEHAAKIEVQNSKILAQNEQLKKLNVEKSKILSVLGHDLRGPLSSITSVLELLTKYPVPEERRREMKLDLLLSIRNTSDMVANLLNWSSQQMNGLQIKLQPLSVLGVAQQVMLLQRPLAAAKAITIRLNIKEEVSVLADANLMEHTLRNIVNNAIKFTLEGGLININAILENDRYILSVRDNGLGMSAEQLAMLFTLDIHSTYGTNNEKGIGLGLALCKEFADLQDGKIWATSEPGKGSTFYISYPAIVEVVVAEQ